MPDILDHEMEVADFWYQGKPLVAGPTLEELKKAAKGELKYDDEDVVAAIVQLMLNCKFRVVLRILEKYKVVQRPLNISPSGWDLDRERRIRAAALYMFHDRVEMDNPCTLCDELDFPYPCPDCFVPKDLIISRPKGHVIKLCTNCIYRLDLNQKCSYRQDEEQA
ncbi:hypothetical protein QBC41DRAFT_332535 [Cercophora samala]|uniref:Uncharacterized protein n=1 Tax=Cercophora samala TaxID=330535 RepID=A0AA40CV97_9PEZI|nr:hypothetical protein QBC41DRAFT_332535 [Cercophora samala]